MTRISARQARNKEINYAREFVGGFSSLDKNDRVVICSVVSFRDRTKNLEDQRLNLMEQVPTGINIVDTIEFIGQRYDPTWLGRILKSCQNQNFDWLLFETTDRILRHPQFKANRKGYTNLHPTREQWIELSQQLKGVKLMSHLDPEANAAQIRSYQRKRGLVKQSKKETPVRKALLLYSGGMSIREIAERLELPKSTIHDWIKKHG